MFGWLRPKLAPDGPVQFHHDVAITKSAEDDYAHMRKVIGYVHRHTAQRPGGDVTDTRWRYSLMNWGHDPLKAESPPPGRRAGAGMAGSRLLRAAPEGARPYRASM